MNTITEDVQQMINESSCRGVLAAILLSRFATPIVESKAFKLGLVDKSGKIIKSPETIEERRALTPVDVYCFRLKRLVQERYIDMLNSTLLVDSISKPLHESKEFDLHQYELEEGFKCRLRGVVEDYKNIALEAQEQNFPLEIIENLLFEELINDSKNL